jgi:exopolysaccharide biosynthesis polyprenyl glycosylphosphotransferase
VATALAWTAGSLLVLAFALKDKDLSRLLTGFYFALALAQLAAVRGLGWLVLRAARRRGHDLRRVAVVGTGGLATEIMASIEAHPERGLELAGTILEDDADGPAPGPVLGRLRHLDCILERQVLDLLVFAVPRERLAAIEDALLLCEEVGVDVELALDVLRVGHARPVLADLDGLPMLAFDRVPGDDLARALKRAFDVTVSGLALLLLSPVLAGVVLAIRLESPGPVFFRQQRVGRHGRLFSMLKFRSMHVDAEARLAGLLARNEMSGPVFKLTHDPRVTRVGRFIRRTSLDELPQFINVLRGEMSVVGPRPPIPAEVAQYQRWHRRRLSVKPGITCTWQISGRNDIDFDRWMELDLEYIDHWSLGLDVAILLKTIPAVLSARGAK